MSRTIIRRDRSSPPRWTGRGLALLLLGAAVLLGLVRSILDTYFTSRVVELPPPPAATWSPLAKRVALVVLDGLRPMEAFDPEYMRAFSERRRQSAWGIARSGEITMTVPGVRMLGAGVSSDFMEILHNWNPRSSPVTSLFTVAKMKGLHTVLYGDHVWKRAFTKDIDSHVDTHLDPWSYYSDPVHAPDLSLLEDLRTLWTSRAPFDLLVIHFVGPDHASHRNRVTSPEFQAFTRWMDPKLDELLDGLLASGATILVTSDHGMSDWGQHGGDEPTARKTPYLLQGPGIKVGPGSLLNQADLPATLAALLGLPMPPFGEGRVAHEVLAASPDTMLAIMRANVAQADTYLRGYQRQYGGVPRSLLDGAPDLARIASQQGTDSALARADQYFQGYYEQRRLVGKSVGRTWAWLLTLLVFSVFVLLPDVRAPLPRRSLAAAGVALLLSLASWVTTILLWPSVVMALVASVWLGWGIAVARRRPVHGALTVASGLIAGGVVTGLLALAHLGFKRQFRSDTMLPGVSDSQIRTTAYFAVLLIGVLYAGWKSRMAGSATASAWMRPVWMGLAVIGLFVLMLPSGKLLLIASGGLGLGILWIHRLARIGEGQPRLRLMTLLESEWFLFLASLAWVCLESWFPAIAPRVDQERGVLGWILNRLPWLLAPALVYQQFLLGKEVEAHHARITKALSFASLAMALPPLLLAHHTSEHSNLLVWLALGAMLLSAVNSRSPTAKYQLGAATYALTSQFGSASYALLCFVLVGTYWAFVLAPRPSGPSAPSPGASDDRPSVAPVLAALGGYFVWLTVHRFRDGSFSFSDIEVAVAFYGNPTHGLGQGAVQVSARFILPMVLLLIPLQRLEAWPRIFAGIIATLLLHIGVLLIGFLATQTQFYTPYRLAGELAHFIAVLASVPLLFLLFAARAGPPRATLAPNDDSRGTLATSG
jgi:hypothetical protein